MSQRLECSSFAPKDLTETGLICRPLSSAFQINDSTASAKTRLATCPEPRNTHCGLDRVHSCAGLVGDDVEPWGGMRLKDSGQPWDGGGDNEAWRCSAARRLQGKHKKPTHTRTTPRSSATASIPYTSCMRRSTCSAYAHVSTAASTSPPLCTSNHLSYNYHDIQAKASRCNK